MSLPFPLAFPSAYASLPTVMPQLAASTQILNASCGCAAMPIGQYALHIP
jgi:hypothetical protein